MLFTLPSPEREKRLRSIQKLLRIHKEEGGITPIGKAVTLMLEEGDFVKDIARSPKLQPPYTNETALLNLVWAFLSRLLHADDFVAAAMLLWDEENFTANPHCVQLVWHALRTQRKICIIGGGAMGKSYSVVAYLLLSWISDPEWCKIEIASESMKHLQKNAWGDMLRLHADASLRLPGKADSESISLQKRRAMGIFTLVLPGGPEGKATLKGAHAKARPPHPKFGRRSRVFCMVDEGQNVPQNIYKQIPNRFSAVADDDVEHQKFILTANPQFPFSEFGACAKPVGGWDSIQRSDETWKSDKGWFVVSLDAMKHENIVQRRSVYPGFITWTGINDRLKDCNGNWEDPRMYTYVFGKFPAAGTALSIIKQQWLTAAEKEWIFASESSAKAGADPAFTGDNPALACGRTGRAIGWIDHSGDRHVLDEPRMVIQLDAVTVVPKSPDGQVIADGYMERLKPLGIEPDGFGIDTTGGGRGPHDIMRRQWGAKVGPLKEGDIAPIRPIEYASSPSTVKVAEEDTLTPKELYNIMASALWFEAAKLFEYGVIGIGKGVDLKVFAELAARQGGMQPGLGKKLGVESKAEFKLRTGMNSPDLADAALIMIHVARLTTPGLIPRAKDTAAEQPERGVAAWSGFSQAFGVASMEGMDGAGETVDTLTD